MHAQPLASSRQLLSREPLAAVSSISKRRAGSYRSPVTSGDDSVATEHRPGRSLQRARVLERS
jgi:hypothetical protein